MRGAKNGRDQLDGDGARARSCDACILKKPREPTIMNHLRGTQIAVLFFFAAATAASAEEPQIRAPQQHGTSSLALMVMQDTKLVEKHAKAARPGEITVIWPT